MSLLFYKDNGTEEHIAGLNGQADLVSGKGVIVQNGEVSQTRDQLTFTGTRNEWDSLSLEQKAQYGIANITDDVASGVPIVVDAVTDGDMNAVTSNAVFNAMFKSLGISPSTITDANTVFWGMCYADSAYCQNLPQAQGYSTSGTLISLVTMPTPTQSTGVQFFIPYQGGSDHNFYFRECTNGFGVWKYSTGQVIS